MKLKGINGILFIAIFSVTNLFSCICFEDIFDIGNYRYNHINKRIIDVNSLYLEQSNSRYPLYWDRYYKNEEISKKMNIDEWYNYFQKRYSKKEVEKWIYTHNKSKIKDRDAEKYILFAKKQEPFVSENRESNDFKNVKELIEEAKKNYNETKSPFLKLRYAFLMMRLAHYHNNSSLALKLYQKYAKPLRVNSIVNEWINALRAGANRQIGNYPLAAYQFAKVFATNKTNNHIGLYDFKITSQREWEELMHLCKNSDEKALMYAIRGLRQNGDGISELQNIYKTSPNVIWFDMILYREYIKIEADYFHYINPKTKEKLDDYKIEEAKRKVNSTKLKIEALKKIIEKVLREKKRKDLFLTKITFAMLNLFEDNYKKSREILKAIKLDNLRDIRKSQVIYLKKLITLLELRKIDSKIEEKIGEDYKNIAEEFKKSYEEILKKVLLKLYPKEEKIKRYLLKNDFGINLYDIDLETMQGVEELKRNAQTPFEKLLVKNYGVTFKGDTISNYIGDIEYDKNYIFGVLYLREFNFKKALEYLKKSKKRVILKYNPFNAFISGNNRKAGKSKISLIKFVSTLIKIENILKKNPNSLMDNYLLANAYYNMSWFGNSPMTTHLYRSVYDFENSPYKSMKEAKKYYKIALKNAKEKNFKAKIIYMLSKCEENEIIVRNKLYSYGNDYGDLQHPKQIADKLKQLGYGKYFTILKKEYSNTKYYKEVLKECGVFEKFN